MHKIKYLLFSLILSIMLIPNVMAATGTVSISSVSQVVIGNKVTVTVSISSSTKIGSWQMNLNYDKNYLQLTSSTAENGTSMVNSAKTDSGVDKQTYTFTFKTLKKGSTTLSIGSALVYPADINQMNTPLTLSLGKKTIKIITQEELEASYSKDNDLKSLSIENFSISPSFKKDTTEYSVVVPENTKSINIKAIANDSKASVSGIGEKTVSAGVNNFDIVVRAENGNEKTYKITVEVKDSNPIEVNIGNDTYTVVKIKEYLPEMKGYDEDIIKIKTFDIPVYKSNTTNLTLVGLKDKNGTIEYYIYKDEEYIKYNEISTNHLVIYPKETKEVLKGYTSEEVEIKGVKTTGWVRGKSNYVVIYGIDVESGEEGFWTYDKKSNTVVKYDDSLVKEINDYENKIKLYTHFIFGFIGLLIVVIILLIVVVSKKRKTIKEIKQKLEEQKRIEEEKNKQKTKESKKKK